MTGEQKRQALAWFDRLEKVVGEWSTKPMDDSKAELTRLVERIADIRRSLDSRPPFDLGSVDVNDIEVLESELADMRDSVNEMENVRPTADMEGEMQVSYGSFTATVDISI